jgi:hypothetical protein
MNQVNNLLPVLTAAIGASALLIGYWYQKSAERDAAIQKTRQEIYSRLIGNVTQRNTLLGRFEQTSPQYLAAKPEERGQLESQFSLKDAELTRNEGERTEIVASLCVFGTDDAIKAYAEYAKANAEGSGGDFPKLVLGLRQSIFKATRVTVPDAGIAIWNDPRYLTKSPAAR